MPIHHATLHQLKIFDTLAEQMSITRTAEVLHLTAPAVSIQIKQLSEAAGQPLLEQVGKKLYLTDAGKLVADACRDLFTRMERLSQELAALSNLERGSLRVSCITTAKYFVPRMLGDFSDLHANIDVSLFVGNRQAVLDRLIHNKDDLYILGRPPEELKVTAIAFAPNPLVAVASPQHPLAGKKRIDPARLESEPFILREPGSGIRKGTEEFFREHQVKLNVRMEMGSNEAVKQTVMARLGLAFLAESSVKHELDTGELAKLDIRGLPLQRQWHVVYPEQKPLSPIALAFQSFLIEQFRKNKKL